MPYGSLLPQLSWRISLPTSTPRQIAPPQPIGGWPTSLRPLITHSKRFRNVDRMSITYASRPRLRVRLTLSGLTLLRKPWVFGDQVSRLVSRYSFRHNHFWFVDGTLRFRFILQQNAPLPRTTSKRRTPAASVVDLSPGHYRRGIT